MIGILWFQEWWSSIYFSFPRLTLVSTLRVFLFSTRASRNEKSDSFTQFPQRKALLKDSNSGWTPRERIKLINVIDKFPSPRFWQVDLLSDVVLSKYRTKSKISKFYFLQRHRFKDSIGTLTWYPY